MSDSKVLLILNYANSKIKIRVDNIYSFFEIAIKFKESD